MSNKDVYEELADMEENEDPGGIPKTEAFLELLRLQFSPEEARLALQIRLTGGTLDELSQKTGIDSDRLKSMLMTMADKGTVFYDPDEENPVYRVVGCTAPGLTETAVWGNIRGKPCLIGVQAFEQNRTHIFGRDDIGHLKCEFGF